MNCGQIDLAVIKFDKRQIMIFEVKNFEHVSKTQKHRLRQSALFLSEIFKFNVKGEVVVPQHLPKGMRFINLF